MTMIFIHSDAARVSRNVTQRDDIRSPTV